MQAQLIKQEAERSLAEYSNHSATLSAKDVSSLSQRAVSLFFDFYQLTGSPLRAAVELLSEINASHNPTHASLGLEALFPNLIEKLNDAFSPPYCTLYDRVFIQVISFLRRLPEGQRIDQALNHFGMHNEATLLRRKRNLKYRKTLLLPSRPLKKILFLSRVTIGADVAVTSVLMAHFKQRFPEAELVLIGSQKLHQLYGGDPQIRVAQIDYGRSSTLLSRLETWLRVLDVIEGEFAGLNPEQYLVIDPDSRLTQLGLLPLLQKQSDDQSYLFFESRRFNHAEYHRLGQLASHWIGNYCGENRSSLPFVTLQPKDLAFGQQVFSYLQNTEYCPVIFLSFGVGGNAIKRVSEQFEMKLVTALSNRAKLIIDCGATPEEHEQVGKLLSILEANGKTNASINNLQALSQLTNYKPDVLTWQGGLGTFASLIAGSNLYIGYDSAGQHIAAALLVPTLTIFVNSGSNIFPLRWHPHGSGRIKTIHLNASQTNGIESSDDAILSQVLSVQEQLLHP